MDKYKSIFNTTTEFVIKTNNNVYHQIPIQSYPYRKSAIETAIINEQVKEILNNQIIRP